MNELQQPPETVSATLDNMLQNLPKNLFLQLNRAILYHNSRGSIYSQDFEEAEQLFHQIHTENPYLVDSMDYYSNVLYVRREYSKLCELAHQSTLVNKYRPETCTIVGNYYSMKGERQKAIESFSRALKLDCNYSPAWTLLGHEYVDSCKPKQAIEVYRKAVDLNPKDYRAWYGLGQAYDLLSLPHYSIYYHQRAIAIRPNDGRMWSALSNSLESVGKFEQAISCLKRVLICSDEIETLDFARIAQLSKKLYDKNGDGMVLAQAADYYEKYLNEVHRTSEAEEFVDEANEFLQSFRKR